MSFPFSFIYYFQKLAIKCLFASMRFVSLWSAIRYLLHLPDCHILVPGVE